MRLPLLFLSAVFALAMTETGHAQATLPNDDVNSANNPGTTREEAPARVEALDCTCRTTPAEAAASPKPEGDTAPGDRIIDCSCRKTVPDTTGALAGPTGPDRRGDRFDRVRSGLFAMIIDTQPAHGKSFKELQRETWDDDGGATPEGPRTTSRVPPGSPASASAGRDPRDRTSRRAGQGSPRTVPRT